MQKVFVAFTKADTSIGRHWKHELHSSGYEPITSLDARSKSHLTELVEQADTIILLWSPNSTRSKRFQYIRHIANKNKIHSINLKISRGRLKFPHIDASLDESSAKAELLAILDSQKRWQISKPQGAIMGLLFILLLMAYLAVDQLALYHHDQSQTTQLLVSDYLTTVPVAVGNTSIDNEHDHDEGISFTTNISSTFVAITPTSENQLAENDLTLVSPISEIISDSNDTSQMNAYESEQYDNGVDFQISPASGQIPLAVQIQNNSEGDYIRFAWDFDGDGFIDSEEFDPGFYTYTEAREYTLTLTGEMADGTRHTASRSITANSTDTGDQPQESSWLVSFDTTPKSGDAPLIVTFENTSIGNFESFEWDFNGDGLVDSFESTTVAYTYESPGTYTASLTGHTDDDSDYDIVQIVVGESSQQDLYADFIPSQINAIVPATINFANESTGNIVKTEWDFNNDNVTDSVEFSPSYTFAHPGEYTTRLTVYDESGQSRIQTRNIKLFGENANLSENEPSLASFYMQPVRGIAPLSVQFINTSTGSNTSYRWDFNNDGKIDNTTANPGTFKFTTPGNYVTKLTVVSADGQETTYQATIVVEASVDNIIEDSLSASFLTSDYFGDAPLTVTFTNDSIGSITAYAWDFNGDGIIDSTSNENLSFTYTEAGEFEASLTVTSSTGETDSFSIPISIYGDIEPITADFFTSETSGNAPLIVEFSDFASGPVTGYNWDFDGDGIIDSRTSGSQTFTYETAGLYEVKLTVRDNTGNLASYSQTIQVLESETQTPTQSPTPTLTLPSSITATLEVTATISGTLPAQTPTPTVTETPSLTPLVSETAIQVTISGTATPTVDITTIADLTDTPTASPTETLTLTPTFTATFTSTWTPTSTLTNTPTSTPANENSSDGETESNEVEVTEVVDSS